jgi:hypothetical protein
VAGSGKTSLFISNLDCRGSVLKRCGSHPNIGRQRKSGALGIIMVASLALGQSAPVSDLRFRAITPLGSDALILQPSKTVVSMMLTLECKELEDMRLVERDSHRAVLNPDGTQVTKYPDNIKFRFTIGSRTPPSESNPLEVKISGTPDDFESHLHFRLKVFHGIESHELTPVEEKIIGVPASMPYDERIYSISFKLNDVPAEDRIMFEVLDNSGARVAKFQMQLM